MQEGRFKMNWGKREHEQKKSRSLENVIQLVFIMILPFLLSACATTTKTRSARPSGFLGDYSELQKGEKEQAQLLYINPDVDWASYDKIMIDSVSIWVTDKNALQNMPVEDQEALTDALYKAYYNELKKDYEIVDEPGPHILRLRLGITEAKGSRVVLDTVTTVVPIGFVLSHGKKLATGTHSFVGKAAIEGEIEDSITDVQLLAFVDERAGGKTLIKGTSSRPSWRDVENSFEFWARQLRQELAELRGARVRH
jgi:hypothetical protein